MEPFWQWLEDFIMPRKWSQFELAVLTSLFRIEQRQVAILNGIGELLSEGPNDPELLAKIKAEADALEKQLDTAGESLKAAVEENS